MAKKKQPYLRYTHANGQRHASGTAVPKKKKASSSAGCVVILIAFASAGLMIAWLLTATRPL